MNYYEELGKIYRGIIAWHDMCYEQRNLYKEGACCHCPMEKQCNSITKDMEKIPHFVADLNFHPMSINDPSCFYEIWRM